MAVKLSNTILNLIKKGEIQKDDSIYLVDVERHLCEEFDWENEEYSFPDDTKLQLVKMSEADPSSKYSDYAEYVITNHVGDIKSDVWNYESFVANDGWVYDIKEGPIPAGEPARLYVDAMWHNVYDVEFIKKHPSSAEWMWNPEDPGEVFYDAWWDYIAKVRRESNDINHI